MGKPSFTSGAPDDAVSLQTQPGDAYLDEDAPELDSDDLPPLYSDIEHSAAAGSSSSSAPLLPQSRNATSLHKAPRRILVTTSSCFSEDATTGAQCYLDSRLDTDAAYLQKHVETWALAPPRPSVRLRGTHWQEVRDGNKTKRESVTDFDVQVDLTPYLYSDVDTFACWRELRTVENGERTRRGGIFRTRAPGATQSIEVGMPARPTLQEWCHRYCASHAGLKAFTLRRNVVGFNWEPVKAKLESMVRYTGYRGHLEVSYPAHDAVVEVYNDCKTNRWRLTSWIRWLFILTLMFIFSWPYLLLRTKRYEVVVVDWHFSRLGRNGKEYVSISETDWLGMWEKPIKKAVLEKRQGTLDQQDLLNAELPGPAFSSGNGTVDGAVNLIRAGIHAMNELNRTRGWGGDE